MNIEEINARIVENIRTLIDEKGTNPSRIAREAGLGHTAVRDILTGKTEMPRYDTLLRIAKAAHVDIRRITVGPNYRDLGDARSAVLGLLLRLSPDELDSVLTEATEVLGSDPKASE